jgi:hypothetical protein
MDTLIIVGSIYMVILSGILALGMVFLPQMRTLTNAINVLILLAFPAYIHSQPWPLVNIVCLAIILTISFVEVGLMFRYYRKHKTLRGWLAYSTGNKTFSYKHSSSELK